MLVSVICLCYNHSSYVHEAIFSVINQSYPSIEILIVDDGSNDYSAETIDALISQYPHIKFIRNSPSIGNCKSFNNALKLCKGNLIIDFAADDVMFPDRVAIQVQEFSKLDNTYGVIYSNAQYIDATGNYLGLHSGKYMHQPSGDIYIDLLQKYFICPPTMMYRRWILEQLGGYNETLHYEDFDFWVRSSRICRYQYIENSTTKKRVVKSSLGSRFTAKNNAIHFSTYQVCKIAYDLNQTIEEHQALAHRIFLETKLCFFTQNFEVVDKYVKLYNKLPTQAKIKNLQIKMYAFLARKKICVFWLYKLIKK